MKNKDIYIKILEFGINRIKGFNYDEVIGDKRLKYLKSWEIEIIDKYFFNAHRNKHNNAMRKPADLETMFVLIQNDNSGYKSKTMKYTLNLDSRFKYIDYIELKEARETANKANKHANYALVAVIITTITSLVISYYLTNWQINSPVEINEKQFNVFLEYSKEQLK